MSSPGESYEQWRERTAPAKPMRTINPRSWDWGVVVLLGLYFGWVLAAGGTQGWIGLALALVLAAESIAHGQMGPALQARYDRLLRGGTLLVTLVLSVWIIVLDGGTTATLPVLLVFLDLKDDRSFLRWALARMRGR